MTLLTMVSATRGSSAFRMRVASNVQDLGGLAVELVKML